MDKLRFKLYPHQVTAFVLMPDGHHISCPNGGKKYGKETPFIGGLRSPLTIPESVPFEIPFRTVGNYPENDIAFFENCDQPASSSEKKFAGRFTLSPGIAHPLNAFKVAALCDKGWVGYGFWGDTSSVAFGDSSITGEGFQRGYLFMHDEPPRKREAFVLQWDYFSCREEVAGTVFSIL